MSGPKRIQLRRTKGWRMPANTAKVARPTRWGNPFYVEYPLHVEDAVRLYRDLIVNREAWICEPDTEYGPGARHRWRGGYSPGGMDHVEPPTVDEVREGLRGKNLACYCPLDQPCHADVLLMARRAELVAVDAIPAVRVGGHRFSDLMALADELGVAEEPSLMPGCLEVEPPPEPVQPACPNAFCTWPAGGCRLDEEFAGAVDAEDFYDPGDTDTCASIAAEEG